MRRQVRGGVAARVLVLAVVLGALVSGCGSGPSQVGAAAIVGQVAVPTQAVEQRMDQALARTELIDELESQGITTADITRDIVTQSVIHQLTVIAAQRYGIVVPDADVDAELAALGGTDAVMQRFVGDLDTVRERFWDQLVAEKLATQQIGGLAVTVDIAAVASRTDAEAVAKILTAGGPAADAYLADNSETSQRAYQYRASTAPEVAASVVFGTAVGGGGWFQPVQGQESWIAFRVLDRRTDAPPVAPEMDAVPQIGRSGLVEIGTRLLQPIADEVGVRVNPRYGLWDPVSMRVLDEEQISGGILPPSPSRP
ncbi:MAG: peptidylprolyl isomerase [Pseudonocardia sp.]